MNSPHATLAGAVNEAGALTAQAARLAEQAQVISAPDLYDLLAEIKLLELPRLCAALAEGLRRSPGSFTLSEDDGKDPAVSIAVAVTHLTEAASAAARMRDELEAAQAAIARQSAHPRRPVAPARLSDRQVS